MRAESKFDIEDQVIIDGDSALKGYVTAVIFRQQNYVDYEVSYIHNGASQMASIEEFRLSRSK